MTARPPKYPETPDGRYFVSKSRMWRKTDPSLPEDARKAAVSDLMKARRAVRFAKTEEETRAARAGVQAAKERLGERGPVWWDDVAEDVTRRAPWNTPYAAWWAGLSEDDRARGT
ncbi:hypothetical protein [Jannaschia donghaensis]|uniref:Uncharacterized protein n=1 Tax=Jannaschia donghaensis TaxID=420998 RepID=A0A0M6YFU4_9RHOB|nr:hypothetical protein [Jannaschia donghaensis]CTQ49228.1 hypothetical protein JDO7802_01240 [Jannaschia donghaensis]